MKPVQKRFFKRVFYQKKMVKNYYYKFSMINVEKRHELCKCFKNKISENLRKNSPRHSPAIPGKTPILRTAPSK